MKRTSIILVAVTLVALPWATSASNVSDANPLAAGQKVCSKRQLKSFLGCAYAEKGSASIWPSLSPCEGQLGKCRGWAYDGLDAQIVTNEDEPFLGVAGLSKNARYFGYYAYGDLDPKKYVPFNCNYVSKLFKKVGRCILGKTTTASQGSLFFERVVVECIRSVLDPAEQSFVFTQTDYTRSAPMEPGLVTYFYISPFLLLANKEATEDCPVVEGYLKKNGSPSVRILKAGAKLTYQE